MRIGISGAQSVGKTTLLNALRSEEQFKNYDVRNEVTRSIRELGLQINENGSDTTQMLIMKEHIYNLVMFDNMLTDRTSLDGVVYSHWLWADGKVSKDVMENVISVFEKTIDMYDYIFYIKPEFEIEDDGIRSSSLTWQSDIVRVFDMYIEARKVPVVTVSGSVRERVDTILKTIGANK